MGVADFLRGMPQPIKIILILIIAIVLLSVVFGNLGTVVGLVIPAAIVYGLWLVLQQLS